MGNIIRTDDNPANRDPITGAPGYRTGYETAGRYMGQNKRSNDLEPELRAQYERIKGKSRLAWEDAKQAARAAWYRVERVMPGDFDNDGR